MLEYFLFLIFSFFLLSSSLCVIVVNNTVQSVLFLIFSFCNGVGLLFLLGAEFLALVFLVVYVGAIAVLFLFVIIILDFKGDIRLKFPKGYFFSSGFFPMLIYLFWFGFINVFFFKRGFPVFDQFVWLEAPFYLEWVNDLDTMGNLSQFSQILYTFYFIYLLLAGFLLLVAIVGAVALILVKNQKLSQKRVQHVSYQLSRATSSAVYLLKRSRTII